MPCVICGNNSFGNDVCPSCEEKQREAEEEQIFIEREQEEQRRKEGAQIDEDEHCGDA
jgi:hypothetical protein